MKSEDRRLPWQGPEAYAWLAQRLHELITEFSKEYVLFWIEVQERSLRPGEGELLSETAGEPPVPYAIGRLESYTGQGIGPSLSTVRAAAAEFIDRGYMRKLRIGRAYRYTVYRSAQGADLSHENGGSDP